MKKVLLVDDDPGLLSGYERQLQKIFTVKTASSPEQALALLSSESDFAVVVSDMSMPGMTGAQFLAEVKTRWPDIIRIMLTGNLDQQTAASAMRDGAVFRFLTKPCATESLAQTIRLALQRHDLLTSRR